jgi:hypothetical protein
MIRCIRELTRTFAGRQGELAALVAVARQSVSEAGF